MLPRRLSTLTPVIYIKINRGKIQVKVKQIFPTGGTYTQTRTNKMLKRRKKY